jgi:hypothetical protein
MHEYHKQRLFDRPGIPAIIRATGQAELPKNLHREEGRKEERTGGGSIIPDLSKSAELNARAAVHELGVKPRLRERPFTIA